MTDITDESEFYDRPNAPAEVAVDDVTDSDPLDVVPLYSMVSYGADLDVAGLVSRMEHEDIEIPDFQRGFVWTPRQAARFIESLLIGLPVPGVFFWRDPTTQKFVVVDGQQRLRSLQAFYRGIIRDRTFQMPRNTSAYQRVHPDFEGKTYRTLREDQRRRLDNSIIHATIVSQESPQDDDSSIFYLFERLNTEGTPLQPQEIRSAIYHGNLNWLLANLNELTEWRAIFGAKSSRMKDTELILRFFALYHARFDKRTNEDEEIPGDLYARPMKEFLNRFARRHRDLRQDETAKWSDRFINTIIHIHNILGRRAFRPSAALNAAVFDAVMIGVARRLEAGDITDHEQFRQAYDQLLLNGDFRDSYARATADADSVASRIRLATAAFASVP